LHLYAKIADAVIIVADVIAADHINHKYTQKIQRLTSTQLQG
jgi:hypothetical protein